MKSKWLIKASQVFLTKVGTEDLSQIPLDMFVDVNSLHIVFSLVHAKEKNVCPLNPSHLYF